jgi:hypothetical protein
MPSHLVRRVAWGLVWRWSILFASLIAPTPPLATTGVAVLLAAGLVASLWRRHDLLGSAWRLLLAVTVVNLGFWLGSPLLVPTITVALVVTVVDLWWSIAGIRTVGERPETAPPTDPADAVLTRISPHEPYRSFLLPDPVAWVEPNRAGAAGLRLLVAACLLLTLFTVGAFTIPSRAPAASATPTPSPTPDARTALAPNGGGDQQPADPVPGVDTSGICVSLPDHRFEVRLPNGQTIIVTTRHRSGCPDLASILKALQNAGGHSN